MNETITQDALGISDTRPSISFTLIGRPASKKNSRQNFINHGRMISLPSKAYASFEKDALTQLLYVKRPQWEVPVQVLYVFYQKGKLSQDVDNAMASINDIVQKAGIIVDDKQIRKGAFEVVASDHWETQVVISVLQ